jgi:hypothetical protein
MRAIYEKILPLIEAAEQQERQVALAQLAARLNERLNQVDLTAGSSHAGFSDVPAHGGERGSESSRPSSVARQAEPSGDRGAKSRPMTGISIGWFQDPEQRFLVQTREEAGHLRVLFNTEHPEIAKATAEPANHFGLISTAMRCIADLVMDWSDERRRRTVPAFESTITTTRVEAADALYAFLMRGLSFNRRGQIAQEAQAVM